MSNVVRTSHHHSLTQLTGTFGQNAEGGWWAIRVSFDGREGRGCGETEREALRAADRDIEDQRG